MLVCGDVVYAQIWQVLTLKNCLEPLSYASTAYFVAWLYFPIDCFVKIWATCKNFLGKWTTAPPWQKIARTPMSGIKCEQSHLNNLAHCALLPTNKLTHLTKSFLLHVERAHCLHGVPENLPSNLGQGLWNCCSINCQVTIKVQSNTEVKKANTNWENNNNNQCIIGI